MKKVHAFPVCNRLFFVLSTRFWADDTNALEDRIEHGADIGNWSFYRQAQPSTFTMTTPVGTSLDMFPAMIPQKGFACNARIALTGP
jgi:hypothetical protein